MASSAWTAGGDLAAHAGGERKETWKDWEDQSVPLVFQPNKRPKQTCVLRGES